MPLPRSYEGVEIAIAQSKIEHPKVSDDTLRATCVVVEEAGEALQAALDYTRNNKLHLAHLLNLVVEIEQCAAACHRLLDEKLYDQIDQETRKWKQK